MFGRRWSVGVVVAIAGAALVACSGSGSETASKDAKGSEAMTSTGTSSSASGSIYTYTMERIDGAPESLEDYKGKVVLVVNVASKCGLTPQYQGLEKLYEDKEGKGFVILGFPANNFMGQEPGSNDQIAQFCSKEYGVSFPMFAKISVKGDDQAPLFQMLSSESEEPTWNFTKYLIGKDGKLVRRFGPRTTPEDPELVNEIDRLLAAG